MPWTTERRLRQSELIRTVRPWEKSTGPRSTEGKARSSRNAFEGGVRERLRNLSAQMNELVGAQRDYLREVRSAWLT